MKQSVSSLKNNKVIIFPAETMYGFSCSFYSDKAINEIFKIKKRNNNKQFIVLTGSFEMAQNIVNIDNKKIEFLKKYNYWPNHLTIIFNSKDNRYKTLALRYSNSGYITELFKKIDFPIISTSVNYSDSPVITDIKLIKKEFNKKIDYINTISPLFKGKASTIIDFTTDKILLIREGEIPYNKIIKDYDEYRNNNK